MKGRLLRALAPSVGTGILRLNCKTVRTRIVGREHLEGTTAGVIYAIWHGRFWLPSALFGFEGSALLVSRSHDGDIIASIAERLGYRTVRGSSSRGGRDALRALEGHLLAGQNVALTPDGPKGPKLAIKPGVLTLSMRTGRPIIPLGASAKPAHTFNSWDHFQVPHLLSRGAVVFLRPFHVNSEESLESQGETLRELLLEAQAQADGIVGQ